MTKYLNFCRACKTDFRSLGAFDAHRVGKNSYTFSQGLKFEPPVEDGRRCLSKSELLKAGWNKDDKGRWRMPGSGYWGDE